MTPMRDARKRLGMTQKQLAEQVGISQAHICNLEKEKEQASPDLAKRLATALGITVMQILFPEEQQK